jgi:hypothetical protein
VSSILTSEFLWGVILGLLLSMVVAGFSTWLEARTRRRIVVDFCDDLIGSICDYIQNLQDNRQRNRIIESEFLELIAAEIIVYGRNREHLPHIGNVQLRNDVRDFFTRVAALLSQARASLTVFNQEMARVNAGGADAAAANQAATIRLGEAHRACDGMVALLTRRGDLQTRLQRARRLF